MMAAIVETATQFLSADPMLRMLQGGLLLLSAVILFLLFFTLRDVLLRSRSFLFQIFAIALVAALPILGFLLYLLIRPARTIAQRECMDMLRSLVEKRSRAKHDSP